MLGTANEETDDEKGIKCVSIGSGPAGRWLVVVEYENNFDVESTRRARRCPQASERISGRAQGAFG